MKIIQNLVLHVGLWCKDTWAQPRTRYSVLGCAFIFLYYLIFSEYFPNNAGRLGHDYALFLPALIDGAFWQSQNGLFSLQWFTPSFCGGLPKLANPNAGYLSVPQFLAFIFSPLTSVKLTLLIFASIGYAGSYGLMRRVFSCSRSVALLCAVLFLFNGMYAHRMIIGHLTFHAFMLVPFISLLLLYPQSNAGDKLVHRMFRLSIAAWCMAYMVFSGMINLILPAMLSIFVIGILYYLNGLRAGFLRVFSVNFALAGALALLFSMFQLVATASYLHQFPRDFYSLPGYPNAIDILTIIFRALFIDPPWQLAAQARVNATWSVERHELEYGVSFVPLMLLLCAAVFASWRKVDLSLIKNHRFLYLIALLFAALSVPIALTFYTPEWNSILKQLPIIKSSSTLVRWYCIYIPAVIFLCGLVLQRHAVLFSMRAPIVFISAFIVLFLNVFSDREYYHKQTYDPAPIENRYEELKSGSFTPGINKVSHGDLLSHSSSIQCYEPIFGYRLESFPKKDLKIGSVFAGSSRFLNMKNPACYQYPDANNCSPGDHFERSDIDTLTLFAQYKTFEFEKSTLQKLADFVSTATAFLWLMFILVLIAMQIRRQYRRMMKA